MSGAFKKFSGPFGLFSVYGVFGLIGLSLMGGAFMTNLEAAVILTWQGQACFSLVSPGGTRVLIDPIPEDIGYKPKKIEADVVTISHEHFDHANTALALGKPKILHGLTTDLKNWQKHDQKIGDVRIRNVGVYHDGSRGSERGLNSVFIFETAGIALVHLGDLGHLLTPDQIKAIGPVDILMIPTGGFYTIDANEAHRVIAQLKPKMVVLPMHYRTDVLTIKELSTIEPFLKKANNAERVKGNVLKLDASIKPKEPEVIILDYK